MNRTLRAQPPEQLQRRPLLEVGAVSDAQLLKRRLILACSAQVSSRLDLASSTDVAYSSGWPPPMRSGALRVAKGSAISALCTSSSWMNRRTRELGSTGGVDARSLWRRRVDDAEIAALPAEVLLSAVEVDKAARDRRQHREHAQSMFSSHRPTV